VNLFHGSVATSYVVGDSTGWTIPSSGAQFYINWASNKNFTIGDTLVFNYDIEKHVVAKVTKSEFDGCDLSNISNSVFPDAPTYVTLDETGQQYFICTVISGHCSAGMKLSINVVNTSTSPATHPAPPLPSI
ncbi:blue copper protein-like, partial [Trifolium medium]|nr:blue copper protein-like [Trifolium medium]